MIQVILLAAGFSRRFGGNKLLANWEHKPLYLHTLLALDQLVRERNDCRLTVVTQYREIEERARNLGAQVYWNHHSEEGISSSLRLGLESAPEAEYYLCCVADQPQLTAQLVNAFLDAFFASGQDLGCVAHKGVPGNPVIFHRRYREELMALQGDVGGKKVLARHPESQFLWEGPGLSDLDTPADFMEQAKKG